MVDVPWQVPTRRAAAWLWLRRRLLATARTLRDLWRGDVRRLPLGADHADAPVLAQSRYPLWGEGDAGEFALDAGKVENLRIALRAFHGVVVPAGATLSFWKQLGRPTARRGYVVGREIRGGCVVPTIAGGVCLISNALSECALRAGFQFVERHRHSARIAGSAPTDADATVAWNHIDLRLRAAHTWRIEIELTPDSFVLCLRAPTQATLRRPTVVAPPRAPAPPAPAARSCLTCDEARCFRHRPAAAGARGREAWLLTQRSPEFARWLSQRCASTPPLILVPHPRAWADPRPHPDWALDLPAAALRAPAAWRRAWCALCLRVAARVPGRRQGGVIAAQRRLAQAYLRALRPEHTRLVVDQALLPWLEQAGALAGRHVEVLAGALPMAEIERRLDAAACLWPEDATLRDFRVAVALRDAEDAALQRVQRIVTPHADVAAQFAAGRVERLPWALPTLPARTRGAAVTPTLVFPASALARKGARELAAAVQGLELRLLVLGTKTDQAALWRGVDVDYVGWRSDWLAQADAVVLPAHVEHAPRALLAAVAAGIPVLATPACGLGALPQVTEVAAGDVAGLRAALREALAGARKRRAG